MLRDPNEVVTARTLPTTLLSTGSTALTLTYAQSKKLCVWGAQSSASRIFLPRPVLGLEFRILFTATAVSTATKIGPTTGFGLDVLVDATTNKYGQSATTAGELGVMVRCVGVSGTRYALIPNRTSTIAYSGASSG